MDKTEFYRGMQIAYIPTHCNGDITHPDVELGFVTSVRGEYAFCRYWSKFSEGELRTKANSELTPKYLLVPFPLKPTAEIDTLLKEM